MTSQNSPRGTDEDARWSRRRALEVGAVTVSAGLAGCVNALPGTKSKFQKQLDRVREATAKYEDPKRALGDGFQVFGPYVPGMGWHFLHPGRGTEAAENGFDLEKPNLLTYVRNDGDLQLGAVEWGGPVDAVPENPDLFADEDGSEQWHVHQAATHVFALPDGGQTKPPDVSLQQWVTNENWSEFRPPDPDLSPGDTVSLNWGSPKGTEGTRTDRTVDVAATHPDLNTLHAWVHTENPEGVLHPMNPDYGGEHSH